MITRSLSFGSIRSVLPALALLFGAIADPVLALQVRVTPQEARLGDTISVTVETDRTQTETPTVRYDGRNFIAFEVRPGSYRALLPTTPLDRPGKRTITVETEEGDAIADVFVGDREFPFQAITLSPSVAAIEGTDYEFNLMDKFRAAATPEQYWNGAFIDPSDGWVSTVFGVRRSYNGVFAENYYHRGIDYAAPTGAPVRAAANGRVALVGYQADGFELHGNAVGIDHGQGVTTTYIHLSAIEVQPGQIVRAGDIIGRVGSTGISTGPHLHWGLFVNGESVDPLPWLEGRIE